MGDLRFKGFAQGGDGDAAVLPHLQIGDGVLIHPHGDLHVFKVHDLDKAGVSAHLVSHLDADLVDLAVEAGLEGIAGGEAHQPLPAGHLVALGHIDLAHRGCRIRRDGFIILHSDGAGKGQRIGDRADAGGVAVVGDGRARLQLGQQDEPECQQGKCQQHQPDQQALEAAESLLLFLHGHCITPLRIAAASSSKASLSPQNRS